MYFVRKIFVKVHLRNLVAYLSVDIFLSKERKKIFILSGNNVKFETGGVVHCYLHISNYFLYLNNDINYIVDVDRILKRGVKDLTLLKSVHS